MARKKTISMNCLSQSSIQNAIKQLRTYQDSLTYKCQMVAQKLAEKGVKNIKMYDISITHSSFVLSEAFRCSHIILATTTYNAGIFESMENFLHVLSSHNLQNRKYVLIQNGSWAPTCGTQMREILEKLKGTEILNDSICIKSTLKEEQIAELDNVVITIEKSLNLK